jgi:hypothetical protein
MKLISSFLIERGEDAFSFGVRENKYEQYGVAMDLVNTFQGAIENRCNAA